MQASSEEPLIGFRRAHKGHLGVILQDELCLHALQQAVHIHQLQRLLVHRHKHQLQALRQLSMLFLRIFPLTRPSSLL